MHKKILQVTIKSITKIESQFPQKNISVRLSIVDPNTKSLLLKRKKSKSCVSSHESTDFISPVSTSPKSLINFSDFGKWDEVFLFNEEVRYLFKKNSILFFEVIDQTIHPKMHSFYPLAWSFLRLSSTTQLNNIDKSITLQLYKYGKGTDTNIINGAPPCILFFNHKEKINAKMFIDLYALDPPEPVVVTTRALTPFEHETGSTDLSVLSISSPKKDSSHSSLGPTTQTYVRNLSNGVTQTISITNYLSPKKKIPIPNYLVKQLPVGDKGAICVRFNNSGKILATAVQNSSQFVIQLYDVSNWSLIIQFSAHLQTIYEISFSKDDNYLLTVSSDSMVKIWDLTFLGLQTSISSISLSHPSFMYTAQFHPQDNAFIAAAGVDGIIYIWNWKEEKLIKQLAGHETRINSIAFSNDGEKLYSGDADGIIYVWESDIKTKFFDESKKITENEILHVPITHIATGKSPFSVLIQTHDNIIRNFETKVMVPSQRYVGAICSKYRMESAFSPDGTMVYAASENGTVNLWSVRGSEPIQVREWKNKFDGNPISSVCWSPKGNLIAFSSFSIGHSILIYGARPIIVRPILKKTNVKETNDDDNDY